MTRTLEILERLIGFETTPDRSNLDLIACCEDILRARGFAVERIADPEEPKAGLYARLGPATEGGILLSAHSDVVPVMGQDWTRPPFRLTREGECLYGRGATDMKGFLASMLALADRVQGASLREPLAFVISYDEEIGCVGIGRMLDRLAPLLRRPRMCIVGEPTEMRVVTGHKGKVALSAVCHGEAGHSALAPRFLNALHPAAALVLALRGLQEELASDGTSDARYAVPHATVHVGRMSGGTAPNIVPDRAELVFELRHLPAEDRDALISRIAEVVDRTRTGTGARIELEQGASYPGLDASEQVDAIRDVQRLAATDGTAVVDFGTEAGFFAGLGIPTMVCGPGSMESQGHKPDEHLAVGQLAACDRMMDRLLASLS